MRANSIDGASAYAGSAARFSSSKGFRVEIVELLDDPGSGERPDELPSARAHRDVGGMMTPPKFSTRKSPLAASRYSTRRPARPSWALRTKRMSYPKIAERLNRERVATAFGGARWY